jgi:transcription elongation factor SPT5
MSNFLNQDFGSDDEEDDFNPGVPDESDAEEPSSKVGLLSLLERQCA